ncbi:MAG: hypothetical protein KAQ64_02160 [Candidatus Pacebacteria bacterium]|nr:hypothetical protein [Candidatus Paceibacterota bacterium]
MESEAYDIDSLSSSELSELLELKIETEEFLNSKYNIGYFHVNLITFVIYLTPFGYTREEAFIKVGRLILKPLSIKIWIPVKKECPKEIESAK